MTSPPPRPFALDAFQAAAIEHLDAGRSVVVAAPTGAGKTVVAEHAIELALAEGRKAFYTTPIKALSNQKYHDFARSWGPDRVGLLTGDTSLNAEADVVVMTTEVLRNMLYSASPTLGRLGCVVLDEVHYLQDPYRGPVWEEVMVHTAADVRLVCLSATVSNADELTAWIETVRGPTALVVEQTRPVSLTNLFMVADRETRRSHLIPTLVDGNANPEGHRFTKVARPRRQGRPRERERFGTPRRHEVIERLIDRQMLPAIVFVFSRAGCDDAVRQVIADGLRLTSGEEQQRIAEICSRHTAHLGASELDVLRYDRFVGALERGIAAHHAGMVPPFKEAVEECFVEGLVKVVFATETLALGINMPARAVVIERLTKFNGDTHQFLTPLEYTQLTGRAGRRGIDDQGYAVVLWSPFVTFEQVAELAASRSFGLRSSFRPTYNMAVNLIRMHDRDGAHRLLDRSFGQYQADGDIARMDKRRSRLEREIAHLRDVLESAGVDTSDTPPDDQVPTRDIVDGLAALRPGDVIASPDGTPGRPAVVLSVGYRSGGMVKVRLVSGSHQRFTLGADDFAHPPEIVGHISLPEPYQPNDGGYQHEVVRILARTRLRNRRRRPDRPARPDLDDERRLLADKTAQLARLEQRIAGRTSRLARQFDDLVGILQILGYVAGWELNPAGDILRGIFHESDLAVAEAVRRGVLDDLSPPDLAAIVACVTYEHRGPEPDAAPRIRSRKLRERLGRLDAIVGELRALETEAGLRLTRELDPGFMAAAHSWAGGDDLADVLDTDEMTGGDFVRQVRQLVDLLHQIGTVAPLVATASAAHAAADALNRGVVSATTIIEEADRDEPAGAGVDTGDTPERGHHDAAR